MYFLLNLSDYVKILAFFTVPALQIWPCHVTQEANFEKKLFFPNSAFNIRKSYKISSRKAFYFRSYQPKTSRGGTLPPSAFRVKQSDRLCLTSAYYNYLKFSANFSVKLSQYLSKAIYVDILECQVVFQHRIIPILLTVLHPYQSADLFLAFDNPTMPLAFCTLVT